MNVFAKWAEVTHRSAAAYRLRGFLMNTARKIVGTVLGDDADVEAGKLWERYQECCRSVMTGAAVLDVGCGAGEHSEEILGLWHAGRFAGIDVSVGIVKDAERKYRLSFLTGNAVSLPLADRSFDVVTSSYLFHHIPPSLRADALREQLRVGRYVLVRDLFAFERGVKRLLYRLYYTVFDGSEYRYTLAEWRALAAAAGAAIVDEGHVRPDLVRNRNCFFLLKSA